MRVKADDDFMVLWSGSVKANHTGHTYFLVFAENGTDPKRWHDLLDPSQVLNFLPLLGLVWMYRRRGNIMRDTGIHVTTLTGRVMDTKNRNAVHGQAESCPWDFGMSASVENIVLLTHSCIYFGSASQLYTFTITELNPIHVYCKCTNSKISQIFN